MSALEEDNSMEMSEPTEKTTTTVTTLKDYRQKLMATHARIKYRERTIKGFKNHLKKGTFPQRMKSIKPYPKMSSSESQAIVNAACDQVQCVILDQMIQEEERKLVEDQDQYQTLKVQRDSDRPQLKTPKKPKKLPMTTLQQELADFQSEFTQLCSILENRQ